jgi:hypothetical protein
MWCRICLQAIKAHVEGEKALLADSINSGPMAELQVRLCSANQATFRSELPHTDAAGL